MHLIFDIESTGFPSKSLLPNHPGQARICQIAALKLDSEFNEVGELYTLIKPDGWQISKGASEVNGITMEMCEKEGRWMGDVINEFLKLEEDCRYRIAHNFKFDEQMLDIEVSCAVQQDINLYDSHAQPNDYCTMELCTPILKLPHIRKNAFGQKHKWPKLSEAFKYFFPNEEMLKAHDAMSDVRATAKIYRKLVELGYIKIETQV